MTLPTKRSIAVVIRNGRQILATRRPDDDDELPGIWGLPAGSFRGAETTKDLIARIGRDKLGVSLTPILWRAHGAQDRKQYRLEMDLWEVALQGVPIQSEWQWTTIEALRPGSLQGSLCCSLALSSLQ